MRGIYCIEHIASGRKYYGSSKNIEKRLHQHKHGLEVGEHHNIQLQRAVVKYGISAFRFYLVEETPLLTGKDLLAYEQIFLDSNINGYNMAPANGGDTISTHPNKEEIRDRIFKSHKQFIDSLSDAEKKSKWGRSGSNNPNWRDGGNNPNYCPTCATRIAKTAIYCGQCRDRTGENNPFFNKHHTEETIQYLREINSGDNSWIKGIAPEKLPYTKQYEISYPNSNTKIVHGLKIIAEEFAVSIENIHATIKRIAAGKVPKRGKLAGVTIKEVK